MRALVMTLVCAALIACTHSPRADDREVRHLVDRLIRSVNEANADDFAACFAADATAFFPSSANAARRQGREGIRGAVAPVFSQGPPATRVTPRELTIDIARNMAYVTFDGGSGIAHARRTLVLRKSDGAWRIVHLHASNVSESE